MKVESSDLNAFLFFTLLSNFVNIFFFVHCLFHRGKKLWRFEFRSPRSISETKSLFFLILKMRFVKLNFLQAQELYLVLRVSKLQRKRCTMFLHSSLGGATRRANNFFCFFLVIVYVLMLNHREIYINHNKHCSCHQNWSIDVQFDKFGDLSKFWKCGN